MGRIEGLQGGAGYCGAEVQGGCGVCGGGGRAAGGGGGLLADYPQGHEVPPFFLIQTSLSLSH